MERKASAASYTKMSETTPTVNGTLSKKYEGDGLPFKGKLIGMEDLSVDRDEKVCLDSMFKLKAVASARGEHKQRIQLNLMLNGVRVYDDATKVQLAFHEVERISFVVIDPRDPRAFGYIYNTSDDRHQFWAIKTLRPAAVTVLALKEVFELAYEQMTINAEKAKAEVNQTTSIPVSPSEPTILTQQLPLQSTPQPTPEPVVQAPTNPITNNIERDRPSTTVTQPLQQSTPIIDLWDLNEPVTQAAPPVNDPLVDIFNFLPTTTAPQKSVSNNVDDLFSVFTTTAAPTSNANTNVFNQSTQQKPVVLQTQPNLLNFTPVSPIAPPKVTNPLSEFDFLGDL